MHIKLQNLNKTYTSTDGTRIEAVKDISLEIPENKIFGIIGKSGAGKSTLVRLISLLESVDTGSIFYNDLRVDNLEKKDLIAQRRKIGMIFQNFNLFSSRTAAKNVSYPMEISGYSKKEIEYRVKEMLSLVDLEDRADAPISTLSGGQKQRIAIARALSIKPDILFCDEATSALDPQTTRSILNLIREIQKKMNLTVVMITHQMEVVRDSCDMVAVVDQGCIVEQGNVKDIFINPKTKITKEFVMNSVNDCKKFLDSGLVRWSNDGGEYSIKFVGKKTDEPILSNVCKKFDIDLNIRAGGIQLLPDEQIGTMITDIIGSEMEVKKALSWLNEKGLIVEKLSDKNFDGE
ncbi:MAG: methionine ABC transporter ATP-binding protein [Treponemataceae bacterium]